MVSDSKIAWIFPGQGAQKVGMGKDLYQSFAEARNVFQAADDALGFSLTHLIFEGPEEELRQTVNAQPALVAMSWACYRAALAAVDGTPVRAPSFLAGHSLGEYTALAFAGVLDFPDTVRLARERGRLMQEAAQQQPGAMAAVLGLDEEAVNALCLECGASLANINCPGQLVVSGSAAGVSGVTAGAPGRGATRAIPLQVSGAFHTSLMAPAAAGLQKYIANLLFRDPALSIVANTSARPLTSAAEIKAELLLQLTSPVQWQRSVEYMIASGVASFVEIGAGKVLTGLVKRINKSVKTLNMGEVSELKNILG